MIYRRKQVDVEERIEDLYKRFNIEKDSKDKSEQALVYLLEDYIEMIVKIEGYCNAMKSLTEELEAIELRKVNRRSIIEYIDLLISNEQSMMKEGYIKRVEEYKIVQKQQRRMQQILSNNESDEISSFKEMMEEKIKTLIPDKKVGEKILTRILEIYKNFQDNILNPEDLKQI